MKQYVQIFEEIKNNSSRIAKENLLKQYQDIEGFQDILRFVYDPMITTGLAKRKIEKDVTVDAAISITNIFDMMKFVKDNNTGNDKVIATVQEFLNTLETEEEKELAKAILVKDLPIGISSVTLNKVYGSDFIGKYSVMLAGKYEAVEKKITGEFAVTLKLDGLRATFFNHESGLKVYTRAGKEIEGLVELEKAFEKLPKGIVYDGELLAENPNKLNSADLFRVTQSIVRKKGAKCGVNFILFDMLPISEFQKGKSRKQYSERKKDMDRLFVEHIETWMRIEKVPTYYVGAEKSVIPIILKEVTEKGYEGLMVNTMTGYYETKRTKSLLKVKKFHTVDLRVVDVQEFSRGGKLGSVIVDYKGHRVQVGSGFSDEEREYYWKNKNELIGKIIEVQYFEESKNELGGISLRFPVFVRLRDDKDEVSYA